MQTETTVTGPIAALLTLAKQIRFAVAAANTATVRDAQRNVIQKIQETFITRNAWFAPSNFFGIHYRPATVADPSAELSTNAYFLIAHEEGATKHASDGQFLAIPTSAIQPDIHAEIPRELRPRNLQSAFLLNTKSGPKLFDRINGRLRVIYNLVEQVHVRKQSTVIEPTAQTYRDRFLPNFAAKLEEALRTAK